MLDVLRIASLISSLGAHLSAGSNGSWSVIDNAAVTRTLTVTPFLSFFGFGVFFVVVVVVVTYSTYVVCIRYWLLFVSVGAPLKQF